VISFTSSSTIHAMPPKGGIWRGECRFYKGASMMRDQTPPFGGVAERMVQKS